MTQTDSPLVLERKVQVISETLGQPFECLEHNGIPTALEQLQKARYRPTTLPELIRGRINNLDDRLWSQWYTTASEENIGQNLKRININSIDPIYALAHGKAAILSKPQRIRAALQRGLTSQYAAYLDQDELNLLLTGHERTFPIFTLDEFLEASQSPDFTEQTIDYVVIHPFAAMQETESGHQKVESLRNNKLFIVRAGSVEQAHQLLDKAVQKYNTEEFGNRHLFKNINPQEAQGRLLCLGNDDFGGLGLFGSDSLDSVARFVGVREGSAEGVQKNL